MDTNTLLVILLFITIVLLLLLVGGLVYYIFRQQSKNSAIAQPQVATKQEPKVNLKDLIEETKAQNEKTVGLCSICEKSLLESTHYEIDKLHFCKEHFDFYNKNTWVPITNQRTTAETPEAGIYIYNFKKDLWDQEKEPCYIQCEYKIDVTNNQIETYVQLHVVKNKKEELGKRIELERPTNE